MIRPMRADDVPSLMRLKESAGWNQTEADWTNVMALEPDGCWVDDHDDEVVASTTAVCYGRELAWIGMVLVLPSWRGRGLARALMEHALQWIEGRGVRQVKLDATDMGRPLYAKLGFRDERPIERWGAAQHDGKFATMFEADLPVKHIAAMDGEAFGVDRAPLIEHLVKTYPGQGAWDADGFVLGRPGSKAYFLGPCAAASPKAATSLIGALMERTPAASFFWDLLPDHLAAVEAAKSLGFERRRQLMRMALRPEPNLPGQPHRVFGAAGFEYG